MLGSLAVFDLDGTLVDTLYDIAKAANAALTDLGYPEHPAVGYMARVGWGIRRLAELALPEGDRTDQSIDELSGRIMERYRDTPMFHTAVYPWIRETLEELVARGVTPAILSNKPDELVKTIVARTLGDIPFADVRGAREGVARKPSPEAVLDVARQAGFAPGRVIVVGDGETDMAAGRAAGMTVWAVGWGYRNRQTLVRAGAMLYLQSPFELYKKTRTNHPFKWT